MTMRTVFGRLVPVGLILCSVLLAGLSLAAAQTQTNSGPARWECEISTFEASDKTNLPPQGAILFVGSSSIRLWKTLAQDFPEHRVLNRGFGGSQIADSVHFAERIVFPYAPRMIVMYAGANDINAGKSPAHKELGRPDLWEDERFQTNPGRVTHRAALIPQLQEVFLTRRTPDWVSGLTRLGIPIGPINDIPAALRHPQVEIRRMLQEVERPGAQPVKLVGPVAKLSRTPAAIQTPPPFLGEQTREILENELGLSARELESLSREKVISLAG